MPKHLAPLALLIFLLPLTTSAQSSSCLSLTHNMGYRATDTTTGGEVSQLQVFLITQGYLSDAPTGFYGTLTKAAVTRFQSAHAITPASGYTGQLTRTAIHTVSCGTSSSSSSSSSQTNCQAGARFNTQTGQPCTTSSQQSTTANSSSNNLASGQIVIPFGSSYAGTYDSYDAYVAAIRARMQMSSTRAAGVSSAITGTDSSVPAGTDAGSGQTPGVSCTIAPVTVPDRCYSRKVIYRHRDENAKGYGGDANFQTPGRLWIDTEPATMTVQSFTTVNDSYTGSISPVGWRQGFSFISDTPCDVTHALPNGRYGGSEVWGVYNFTVISAADQDKLENHPGGSVFSGGTYNPDNKSYLVPKGGVVSNGTYDSTHKCYKLSNGGCLTDGTYNAANNTFTINSMAGTGVFLTLPTNGKGGGALTRGLYDAAQNTYTFYDALSCGSNGNCFDINDLKKYDLILRPNTTYYLHVFPNAGGDGWRVPGISNLAEWTNQSLSASAAYDQCTADSYAWDSSHGGCLKYATDYYAPFVGGEIHENQSLSLTKYTNKVPPVLPACPAGPAVTPPGAGGTTSANPEVLDRIDPDGCEGVANGIQVGARTCTVNVRWKSTNSSAALYNKTTGAQCSTTQGTVRCDLTYGYNDFEIRSGSNVTAHMRAYATCVGNWDGTMCQAR